MLHTEIKDEVLFIKLNRPEKRNAINDEIILQLDSIFSSVSPEVRCAIIYGEGKHFSAGLDLSDLTERNAIQGIHHSRMWHRAMDKIQYGTVPVIAVLHGACIGGGLELASACHIRVSDISTYYALPEGQRGIYVGGGSSIRLPQLIGIQRMTDMMLTGRVYNAEEGERIGIAQYLTVIGKALEKGIELAQKIKTNSSLTNYAVTNVLPRIIGAGTDSGLMMESLMAAIAQDTPDAKARLNDFLEGRANKVSTPEP